MTTHRTIVAAFVTLGLWACSASSSGGGSGSSGSKPKVETRTDDKTETKTQTGTKTDTSSKSDNCASLALAGKHPTYDDDVKAVIDRSCASSNCHGEGAQDPILTTYDKIKAVKVRVGSTVADQSMPPRDNLDQKDIDLIALWASEGFREKEGDEIKSGASEGSDPDSEDCKN